MVGEGNGVELPGEHEVTVLIAEDYPDFRARLVRMLEPLGLRCIAAFDGQAAIEVLQDSGTPVHLVVTDLDMPRRTGWDVIAAVRALRDPRLPVIMQTGEAGRIDVQERAARLGVPLVEKLAVEAFLPGLVQDALKGLMARDGR